MTSKATPRYPESSEREYQRVTNGYMRLLNKTLKAHLPAILEAYRRGLRKDSRFDDGEDFNNAVSLEFQNVREELEEKIAAYGLEDFVEKIGKMARNRSVADWKRIVQDTLGIDLMDDYYKGDFYAKMLREWADDNVSQIKSIPRDTLGEMQELIVNGYKQGMSIRDLTKQISKTYGVTKHKAAMLARDQLATLNAQITQSQQRDAGVTKYKWSDSRDSRVRDCHRSLNGHIFSWDDPPEMWYETKKSGKVFTGRRCHPGEDYCCRCVAIPVFDIDTIDVPMKDPE